MHYLSGRPRLSSLGIGIAAYVIGTVFAAAVTTHAIVRVGAAVLEQFAPAADALVGRGPRYDPRPCSRSIAKPP